MWVYDSNTDELYHYGRKGMKWGQNIFGKVKTAAGNARAKIAEKRAANRKAKAAEALRKKPISKLTEEELKARTERVRKENELRELERKNQPITNDQVSAAGKKFLSKFANDAVMPALTNVAKRKIEDFLKSKLGIDAEDTSNSMDLLKGDISKLSDSQISKLNKRAENTSNIQKILLGKKEKSDDDVDDGSNSDKYDGNISDLTDKQIQKQRKRRENIDFIRKSVEKDTKVEDLSNKTIEDGISWMNDFWEA